MSQTNACHDPSKPDLDWSQVRETVRMLNLAVAQISMSMLKGDDSVDALTDSFTSMMHGVQSIASISKTFPDHVNEDNQAKKEVIEDNANSITGKLHSAIVAMQFYDKLTQHLSHVSNNLEALAELINNEDRLFDPDEWSALQDEIRSGYSTQEERLMFEALMQGNTVEQALEVMAKHKAEHGNESDNSIELF